MKRINKISTFIGVLLLLMTLQMPFSLIVKADSVNDHEGKIVILHSNDVHGAIDGYPVMKGFADEIESEGGEVILVDAGDFAQGNSYAFFTEGKDIVDLMNLVGYDIVTVGNHEFDYGISRMQEIMAELSADTVSINILKDGTQLFNSSSLMEIDGIKLALSE